MRTLSRSRATLVLITALAFLMSSTAGANPRRKAKPITQADFDRLEKKVEDQQKQIDKLVKLQQQYLAALSAIFEGTASSSGPAPAPATTPAPASDKRVDAPPTSNTGAEIKTLAPKPAVAVQPRSTAEPVRPKKVEAAGMGTVVGKVAGAPNAIVYVEDIIAPVKATASMKQEGKQFVPQVLVVAKGTTVDFPNRDAIFHNVFSVTPDHSFDLGSYRQGETKSVTMSKPGVLTVYCNMHPQMVGHILVVPNSNYVRAGADGFFRLPNVPAGNHRIVAWAPNAKPVVVQANVVEGEVATVELSLKKGRAAPHTKKDGLPYGSYEK
jgi:plastocyanin